MQPAPLPETLQFKAPAAFVPVGLAFLLLAAICAATLLCLAGLGSGFVGVLGLAAAAALSAGFVRRSLGIDRLELRGDGTGRIDIKGQASAQCRSVSWNEPFFLPGAALVRLRGSVGGEPYLFGVSGGEQMRLLSIFFEQVKKQAHAEAFAADNAQAQ